MAFKKIDIHPLDLEKAKEKFAKKSPLESKKVFEYLRLLSLGEINKGREITPRRQLRVLYNLNCIIPHIKKPLDKWVKEDIREYIEKLQNDKITRFDKKPFSDSTKADVKIQLKSYLKWRLPKKHDELCSWISTRLKKKSPEVLSESEIIKLYNSASLEGKFIISVLFDAGCRIEEFLNIRHEDITEPSQNFPYYKIDFKEEYSKTQGRQIGLYWLNSTESIRNYLNTKTDKNPSSQVIPKTYNAVRVYLSRLGKRVLNKRVHPHIFRKSSATYYSNKLNRQQLCVRYGWRFSSDMVDVYIQRAGVHEKEVKEVMLNTDMNVLRKENQELKTQMGILQSVNEKRIAEIEKALNKFKELQPTFEKQGQITNKLIVFERMRQLKEKNPGITEKKFLEEGIKVSKELKTHEHSNENLD